MAASGFEQEFIELLGPEAIPKLRAAEAVVDAMAVKILKLNEELSKVGTGSGLKDAVNSQTQFNQKQKEAVDSVEKLRLAEIRLQQQREKAFDNFEKKLKAQEAASAKAAAAEAKNNADIGNEYLQLSKAYTEAALRAKNYYLTLGATHTSTVTAIADAKKLSDQLKALDAATGQHTRNVGNYSSATNGLRNSFQQIARELPSISNGFATFASAIGNNIAPAQDAIRAFVAEQKALKEQGLPTQSILKAVAGSIFNVQTALLLAVTALTVYGKEIGEFIFGTKKAKEANDDFSQSLSDLNEKLEFGATNLDRTAKLRLAQAKARGASDKEIASIEQDGYKSRIQQQEEFIQESIDNEVYYTDLLSKIQGGIKLEKDGKLLKEEDIAKNLAEARKQTVKLGEQQRAIEADAEIARLNALAPKKAKAARDSTNAQLKEEENYTESLYEQDILRADFEAKAQKRIADNEKKTLDERLLANDLYNNAVIRGIYFRDAQERQVIQDRLDKIAEIEAKPAAARTNQESALLRNKALYQQQLLNLTQETEFKVTDAIETAEVRQTAIVDREEKERLRLRQEGLKNLKDAADDIGSTGASQTRAQYEKEIADKRNLQLQAAQDAVRVESELLGIVSDASRKKIDDLDREIAKVKELESVRRKEIETSGLTEAQQKEAIAALEAKTANDIYNLNEKKRAQQIKQARFEKAANIAVLIQETAIAVVRALGSKPYTPANIALAIGTGVIGAAQIARAVATPIPTYKLGAGVNGRPAHPGGPAIVGDGGVQEVINENGKLYLSPAKSTAVELAKGAIVYPSVQDYIDRANQITMRGMGVMKRVDERPPLSTREMERLLKKGFQQVANAIHGKETVKIIGSDWHNYTNDIYH